MKRFTALAVLFAALLFSSGSAFADTKQTVTIPKPVMVGTVRLLPNDYDVAWTGDTGVVQVTFTQNKKSFVTSAARLVPGANRYVGVESGTKDGVAFIEAIRMKNATSLLRRAAPAAQ